MTIVYCDWTTGNDTTGDGSYSNPYKTITKASTGLTGGDEVRVAKSPSPATLTGTISFTEHDVDVVGSGTSFTTELTIGDMIEGGDGYWYKVYTIADNTNLVLYEYYAGDTESGVTLRKLGITDTGQSASTTTTIQEVMSSGTASADLIISGGWDLATQTRDGATYFRQTHTSGITYRYGNALKVNIKNYVTIKYLNFVRYYYGVYCYSSTYVNYENCGVFDCNYGARYYGSYYGHIKDHLDIATNNGIGIDYCHNCQFENITICSGYGELDISSSSFCDIKNLTIKHADYGIYISYSNSINVYSYYSKANDYGVWLEYSSHINLYNIETDSSFEAGIVISNGKYNIGKWTTSNETALKGWWEEYSDTDYDYLACIESLNGITTMLKPYANCIKQAATAGGTGYEWKVTISNALGNISHPFPLSLAKVAVAENEQVTVTLYAKKSSISDIAGRLICRGGQIDGVSSDVYEETPENTYRNQLSINFTPTESGVVEIEVLTYATGGTGNIIYDDISISQG
jgi:hypothetical protein